MRYLFVLYIGFDRHGPSVHLMTDMIAACLEAGHSVDMIVRNRRGPDDDIPAKLKGYDKLTCHVIKDRPQVRSALVRRYVEDIAYAYKCRKIYRRSGKYDAVFLQSNTTPYFALRLIRRTLRAPVLFNVQNIFPIDAKVLGKLSDKRLKGIAYRLLRRLQQRAYSMCDSIVTISEDMKRTLVAEGVPDDRIRVIYNWGYDDTPLNVPWEDNHFVGAYNVDRDEFRVVFAGNLGAMVDVRVIAEAAEILAGKRDIVFYIIGDGNNMPLMRRLKEEMGLNNVRIFPYQPVEYAMHNYLMASVNINALPQGIIGTCMPSKTAMMLRSSRPMVVAVETDSAYADILSKVDKCKVVSCGDSVAFAAAIMDIYKSGDTEGSDNAVQTALQMCPTDNAKEYVRCLEEIVTTKRTRDDTV